MEIKNISALAGDISTFATANYKILATAQMTISDQTDAANLAGNMTVVSGSKSQIYLTGASNAFTPDWSASGSYLVLRPFMVASNVTRGQDLTKYNPDLFDPFEYPDLTAPGDAGVTSSYIKDISWFLVDSAGVQTKIDPTTDPNYSHSWTYKNPKPGGTAANINDARNLVIKSNILQKDSTATIMVKFAYRDHFADMDIPVTYTMELQCISTGMGTSRVTIDSIDGNSFYNTVPGTLRFHAEYYSNGVLEDLESILSSNRNLTCLWYIRFPASGGDGWKLLDSVNQDSNDLNTPTNKAYEIHKVTHYDPATNVYTTEATNNVKGGTVLIAHPDLIAGSDVVKVVITDDTQSGQKFNALEVIYDYTDPTRAYIHSSNGDKLFKGMTTVGTIIKPVITYQGTLLDDSDPKYGEGTNAAAGIFDYYWYRIESDGNTIYNIYVDGGTLQAKKVADADFVAPTWPKHTDRRLSIRPDDIDKKGTFTIDIVDKLVTHKMQKRASFFENSLSEDDLHYASYLIGEGGGNVYDIEAVMALANEIKTFIVQQESVILSTLNKE